MKQRGLKFLFLLLSLALLVGVLSGMSAYAEEYPIWIRDKQVTDDYKSGDGWSYNNNTLTLDNFNFTATSDADVYGTTVTGCIYIGSSSDSITIELKGENKLTNNINYGCGIYSRSALIFSGSGSLIASGDDDGNGIFSSSDITVESGNITATGNIGLVSESGVIKIQGGTVTANGNGAGIITGIRSNGNGIIITDGTVKAYGSFWGLFASESSVEIDSGRVTVTASGGTGILSPSGVLQINGGIVIASGSVQAIGFNVKNTIAGIGWTNAAGTGQGTEISTSSAGRDLSYIKVQFPAAADSFTVTYVANNGTDQKAEDGPHEAGSYKIQAYDKNFTAPDGQVFVCWKDGNGTEYKNEQIINLSANLTLYAQWKDASQGGDSDGGSSSGGVDLVFNIPGADDSWEYVGGYAPQQAYRVSLAPMQGGSAALGLTTGDSGTALNVYPTSAVYVFPNANPGYTLDKIVWSLIDGSASYDITEAKNFVMPAMDVVVYVTFRPVG